MSNIALNFPSIVNRIQLSRKSNTFMQITLLLKYDLTQQNVKNVGYKFDVSKYDFHFEVLLYRKVIFDREECG